jgi:hypothetical protein
MGKPDLGDRIAQVLVVLATLFSLAIGICMLVDPFGWYQALPTVKFTGPPNQHFIRDIGLAYLTCAFLLGFAAVNVRMRWIAAFAGSLWLAMHGILHIWEVTNGICSTSAFLMDAPAVIAPPLLVWIAIGIVFSRQRMFPAGAAGPI